MTASLTPRMSQALSFIRSYAAENGIVPTYVEIGVHLELRSLSGVHRIVHELQERGAIRLMSGGKARCIMIDEPDAVAVSIPRDLFNLYRDYAKRTSTSPDVAIREMLRASMGEV